MNIEEIRTYCLSKKGTTEDFPFDETTLVFKVGGKMYALVSLDETPLRINLKCNPDKAISLREEYSFVIPGYHMNKKHWNTIILQTETPAQFITGLIDDSYGLIYDSLPARTQKQIE
jgi:predicted DNA-binding protein (MmcQ/YjbR family)